ncbi:MAG TPA: hypothetical protein VGR26_07095 [Acidimicrobiales bacterium]|nr:hypothetical protein [Acidimicrobiales bacterium]
MVGPSAEPAFDGLAQSRLRLTFDANRCTNEVQDDLALINLRTRNLHKTSLSQQGDTAC